MQEKIVGLQTELQRARSAVKEEEEKLDGERTDMRSRLETLEKELR